VGHSTSIKIGMYRSAGPTSADAILTCIKRYWLGLGLLAYEPFHHALGIWEILLPPSSSAIGLRLMQLSRHCGNTSLLLAGRPPIAFQRSPDRSLILRRGFYYYFLDLLFDQPLGKQL
jgi:hypothetical protein